MSFGCFLLSDEVSLRYDAGSSRTFGFHDLHVAGPPCVDYSSLGKQKREAGPTRIVFILWACGVRDHRPQVVVFENVVRFPVGLLRLLLDDLCCIEHVVLDAAETGGPAHRRRLYCVMTLRRHVCMTRALGDFNSIMPRPGIGNLSASDLILDTSYNCELSVSARRYKADCENIYGYVDGLYDLSQNPRERARAARGDSSLFTVTANTSMVVVCRP